MKKIKIAFVKQEVYQDLYVCSHNEKSDLSILLSSMGRVGPIGLISDLSSDFFIVKEEYSKETQVYKKVIPEISDDLQLLKTKVLNELPNQEFKRPGSSFPSGKFAINASEVDWGNYDIVISINISLPYSLIKKHNNTLFCYMIGEANLANLRASFGYDICLNQQARGFSNFKRGIIDFPYTFLKGNSLEKMLSKKFDISNKSGIYIEINSCKGRPVKEVPSDFKEISSKTNMDVKLHKQLIEENLLEISNSKFYVKYGGRITRGNGAVEAISLGTLVIINSNDIIHKEIILKELEFNSKAELIELLSRLDKNDKEYQRLLTAQRALVDRYFYNVPLENLIKALEMKRNGVLKRDNILLINLKNFIEKIYLKIAKKLNIKK